MFLFPIFKITRPGLVTAGTLVILLPGFLSGQTRDPATVPSAVVEGFKTASAIELPASPGFQEYLEAALRRNPGIQAAYARWQSALQQVAVARGLPNPTVNISYFLESVETAVGPQQLRISISQMFPWFGKLRLEGDIQTLEAGQRLEELQAGINNLRYRLYIVYLDLYFLEKSLEITSQNLELLASWEEVVRSKYTTTAASHPDLVKTRIERLKLEDNLQTIVARKPPFLRTFQSLLDADTLTAVQVPRQLEIRLPVPERGEVERILQASNPELRQAGLRMAQSRQAVRRAKLNYYPDLGLGLDNIVTGERSMNGSPVPESGKDPRMLMFSVSLPVWWRKNHRQVEAARLKQRNSEEQLHNVTNQLEVELEHLWYELEDGGRKITLYRDQLIPSSLELLRSTEKAYIADKLDFLNLVDAQRRYLDFLLGYERAVVQYQKAWAGIEKLAGRTL